MSSNNLDVLMPIVILMATAVAMVFGALIVGKFLRPSNPTPLKSTPYECGESPVGTAWSNFNVRFYVIALIFIIFDVESALMFPVAAVFRKFNDVGAGAPIFISILIFIGVLIEGIVYCWRKGDLDWVKSYQVSQDETQGEKSV